MSVLFVTTLLALTTSYADDKPNLDGKWLVVYAEEGGRRNNSWEQQLAILKDDTLTYEDAGKKRTVKLKFGAHQTVEAMRGGEGGEEKPHKGVYVAAQDYLVISLEAGEGKKPAAGQGHRSSGDFVLILRKQGTPK
jgi:uncharacterized protein (TIGR03067 family)